MTYIISRRRGHSNSKQVPALTTTLHVEPDYKFGMTKCKSISTPLDRNMKLSTDSGKFCKSMQYQHIIRSLVYLTITRPDHSYPVGLLS